ncbi:chlorophyllase [Marchantia polymorpha subsp. ruderalis]
MGTRRNMDVRLGAIWALLGTLFAIMACARANQLTDADEMRLAPDIYNEGPLTVDLFSVSSDALSGYKHRRSSKEAYAALKLAEDPPRPLLIAAPKTAGSYPVILFQHGYTMKNTFYSQMLKHIASHGFIVVAPQMYIFAGADATGEIISAGSVLDWFSVGLQDAISQRVPSVKADLKRAAVVGHSRGGKVVFGIATGVCNTSLKISALVGIDPVDGTGVGHQTKPPILQYSPHSLDLKIPTLIIGAGLGSVGRFLFPACAPKGVNHEAFFSDSASPAFHFVAPDYGHMDYLDDVCPGAQGWIAACLCKNGQAREPMRRFSAGIVVAFLQAALLQDSSQLATAILEPSLAPVKLETPGVFGTLADVTSYSRDSVTM